MAQDYIPRSDADLISFANNFKTVTAKNLATYSLNATDDSDLDTVIGSFASAYNNNNSAQTAARAARQAKDDARNLLVSKLRELAQRIQVTASVTNEQKAELNITVSDGTKTASGVPTSRPIAQIDTSQPLRHTIKFYDNSSESKARPSGVMGAEIWVKIGGEATMNEDDYKFLALDTATPYIAIHKAEDIGKKAHYMLRWVSTRSDKGAWSDVSSGIITG
jgi:hypothetical protein